MGDGGGCISEKDTRRESKERNSLHKQLTWIIPLILKSGKFPTPSSVTQKITLPGCLTAKILADDRSKVRELAEEKLAGGSSSMAKTWHAVFSEKQG